MPPDCRSCPAWFVTRKWRRARDPACDPPHRPRTRRAYVWPGHHFASNRTGTQYPPLGQRFRLRADFEITGYSGQAQVILRALKKYGMLLADNGSAWFISGAPDERWDSDQLRELRRVRGSDLEAVDTNSLMLNPDTGQVRAQNRNPVK